MAFNVETAFNQFVTDQKNDMAALRDEVRTASMVKKTGAQPVRLQSNFLGGSDPRQNNWQGGIPSIRLAPDGGLMGSKGFSFCNMLLTIGRPEQFPVNRTAPNEFALMEELTHQMGQYKYAAGGNAVTFGEKSHACGYGRLAPVFPDLLGIDNATDNPISAAQAYGYKTYLEGGIEGFDPDEARWMIEKNSDLQRMFGSKSFGTKAAGTPSPAQSAWADDSLGGTLIGPPSFGPPIELLRNKEALMNAGAKVIPLGPTGQILMPRLVSPTTATMSPENQFNTPTQVKTGQLSLRAKKCFCVVVMPGELLRFGGPIVEQLVREDMMKSVALLMDYLLLFGGSGLQNASGASDVSPLGLQTMMNSTVTAANGGLYVAPTAGVPGVSGYGNPIIGPSAANQLAGQDIYDFISTIMANNGEPQAFIMNPRLFYALRKTRWTTFNGSGQVGGFLFDFIRGTDSKPTAYLDMCKIVNTAQIPTNLATNGTNTNTLTTLFCGDFPTYMIGLFGAIEFAQEAGGIQLFGADQVAVRALASFDGAPRYPGLISGLNQSNYTSLAIN